MSQATGTDRTSCTWVASAPIPTRFGTFTTHVFRAVELEGDEEVEKEHVALVFGDVKGVRGVPARVHSECITSEVFGSLKCDCKDQLDAAMADIARRGAGVIFYMRQEGRGIGLGNKIRAYALQAEGHDTVDANRLLGLPDDQRRYDAVVHMMEHLGIPSLRLMTNNPLKVQSLERLGVEVLGRVPVICTPNPHSAGYLETKRLRMAHQLPARPVDAAE
jgi:GTP cyclohydrolase II